MDVVCVKKRKLNKHIREGFRILARIIAREYLKNKQKFVMERLPEKKEVS
jgi:hypothetical protein